MRQKLLKKQFAAIALIVFLSLSIILIILTFMYNKYLAEEKYKTLKKTCESVCDFIKIGTQDEENVYDEHSIYYIIKNLSTVSDCDIFVIDQNSVVKICSCEEWESEGICEHSGSSLNISSIIAESSSKQKNLTTLDFYSNPHHAVAVAIEVEDVKTGYVVAADSIDEARDLMKKITRIYAVSAIVPLLLMFVALSAMTYRLTKPLRLMSDAARAMSKGDFSRRIPITRDDEIGQLAVAFNQMTNSLARLEEVRKSFIANVSHELKTPITTIGGFIDGIIDGTIPPEREQHYLQIVRQEINRISRMVESMLSISSLESNETALKCEEFDFKDEVINIVLGQEQRINNKNITVEGLEKFTNVTINADKDMIYRVVYNLVDNAIKFTDDNGKISFDMRYDSDALTFKIENTGNGIAQSELPYVFERFYKVDKSRSENKESTGLGLYIVKTIIKKHGGVIKVSSVENQFTAFEFTLPINRKEI